LVRCWCGSMPGVLSTVAFLITRRLPRLVGLVTPLDPNLDTPAITASPVLPRHAYLSSGLLATSTAPASTTDPATRTTVGLRLIAHPRESARTGPSPHRLDPGSAGWCSGPYVVRAHPGRHPRPFQPVRSAPAFAVTTTLTPPRPPTAPRSHRRQSHPEPASRPAPRPPRLPFHSCSCCEQHRAELPTVPAVGPSDQMKQRRKPLGAAWRWPNRATGGPHVHAT